MHGADRLVALHYMKGSLRIGSGGCLCKNLILSIRSSVKNAANSDINLP